LGFSKIAVQQPVEDMDKPVVEHGVLLPIVDGNELGVGTTGIGLTPALPIATEPNGIPARETTPGDVDAVAADVETVLLELVPHTTDAVALPCNDVAVPNPIPPPPKLVLEPDIPDGGPATAEHVVPLPVIPIVPVEPGLSPGDASSVAPIGIPVGATDEPGAMPSGEVALIAGIGLAFPPTCAKTGLALKSTVRVAAINAGRMTISS
jgi:hypothetical protein